MHSLLLKLGAVLLQILDGGFLLCSPHILPCWLCKCNWRRDILVGRHSVVGVGRLAVFWVSTWTCLL